MPVNDMDVQGKPISPELVEALLHHASTRAINTAALHAAKVTQSESARVNGALVEDVNFALNGGCVCLNNFLCPKNDWGLFDALKRELTQYSGDNLKRTDAQEGESKGLVDWSKHEVFENPTTISATFNSIIEVMDRFFDVEVYATRLNYYRDGSTWKPFHHDSHAYGGKALREDFTIGVSLGESRLLDFLHQPSTKTFSFPQENGDCFAFTSDVNTRFMHGVPKDSNPRCRPRFSIIAWGRRRSLNARNGGGAQTHEAFVARSMTTVEDALEAAYAMVGRQASAGMGSRTETSGSGSEGGAQAKGKAADKKKKNRLQ
jgi:hypothetical protein